MIIKLVLAFFIFVLFYVTLVTNNIPVSKAQQTVDVNMNTPAAQTRPPAEPKLLSIPKLNVYVPLEKVSINSDGSMGTPQDFNNAGWYGLGYKPGEMGSAVIDGHLDTVTGAPAVFYHLADLEKGDQISVTDNNDNIYTFVVTSKQIYPYDNAPVGQIVYSQGKPTLNLITCNGTWDESSHNYSNRIVIYSELEQ